MTKQGLTDSTQNNAKNADVKELYASYSLSSLVKDTSNSVSLTSN